MLSPVRRRPKKRYKEIMVEKEGGVAEGVDLRKKKRGRRIGKPAD